MFDPRCVICQRPAVRDAVASRLAAAETPAEIFDRAGAEFGFSRAGIYRHARHSRGPLDVAYIDGDGTVGDLAADVNRHRRQLSAALDAAVENGNSREAAALSREHNSTVATLRVLGVVDEGVIEVLTENDDIRASIRRAILTRPEWGNEFAAAAAFEEKPVLAAALSRAAGNARAAKKEIR